MTVEPAVVVIAALTAVVIVGTAGGLAWLMSSVDWFADDDFTESELQARIDALFKEES